MRRYQKVILAILFVITLVVGGACLYAIKVTNEAKDTVGNITNKLNRQTRQVDTAASEPTSFLLMGIDEGVNVGSGDTSVEGVDRTSPGYQARSDSMIYVTLNPKNKQATMVSLDRDMDIKIAGKTDSNGEPYYSKLAHAYAYGAAENGIAAGSKMAIETVEELLDVPADHYITINMQGLEDLIDAVGGIDVDNKYHWALDGVELYPGKQHLDGKAGLEYSRYRKYDETTGMGDPNGDIGRQERQREVIKLVMEKILSLGTVTNYQRIFKAIEKNVTTDLSWNEILNIGEGYTGCMENIVPLQLQGQYYYTYNPETYWEIPGINSLLDIQNTIKTQLGLPTATVLPNLSRLDSNSKFCDDMHFDMDAGSREDIDPYMYWEGPIFKLEEDYWTKNFDKSTAYPEDFAY